MAPPPTESGLEARKSPAGDAWERRALPARGAARRPQAAHPQQPAQASMSLVAREPLSSPSRADIPSPAAHSSPSANRSRPDTVERSSPTWLLVASVDSGWEGCGLFLEQDSV